MSLVQPKEEAAQLQVSAGLEDHLMSEDSQVHHGVIVLIIPPLDVIQLTTFVDSASIK